MTTPKPDADGPESKLTHCSGCGAAYSPANPCWDDDGCWDEDGIECHRNGKCKACADKRHNAASPDQPCAARNCREREVAACAEWLIRKGFLEAGEYLRRNRPTPTAPCPLEQEWKQKIFTHKHLDAACVEFGCQSLKIETLETENVQLRVQLAESEESLRLEHEAFEQYMEVGERAREERDSLRAQLAEAEAARDLAISKLSEASRELGLQDARLAEAWDGLSDITAYGEGTAAGEHAAALLARLEKE